MPRVVPRTLAVLCTLAIAPSARADEDPRPVRHPVSRPAEKAEARPGGSSGFWLGAGGIGVALAAFGAVSLAAKRARPSSESKTLKVVGRASLSPRHAIHLVRVGDRILIVGTGPQGAPALLGEMDEPVAEAASTAIPRPHGATLQAAGRGGTP